MPINIASYIQPAGGGTFPLVEDKYILGGMRTVANITERNAIPSNNRKAGMVVVCIDTMDTWRLASDLLTWALDKSTISVATVGDLASVPDTATTVFVKDTLQGGMFVWKSKGTANGGTIFAGVTGYWHRVFSGGIDVHWFGAKGDNVATDTVPFQSALDAAYSAGSFVTVPAGTYRIDDELLVRCSIKGEDYKSTYLKSMITTSSLITKHKLQYPSGKNAIAYEGTTKAILNADGAPAGTTLEEMTVGSSIFANSDALIATLPTITGIRAGRLNNAIGNGSFSRCNIRNLKIQGCHTAMDITGFLLNFSGVYMGSCKYGIVASEFNNVFATIQMENVAVPLNIFDATQVVFESLITEGGLTWGASMLDACRSFRINGLYVEGGVLGDALFKIGARSPVDGTIPLVTMKCADISIMGVDTVVTSLVYPFAIVDQVEGIHFGGTLAYQNGISITTTENSFSVDMDNMTIARTSGIKTNGSQKKYLTGSAPRQFLPNNTFKYCGNYGPSGYRTTKSNITLTKTGLTDPSGIMPLTGESMFKVTNVNPGGILSSHVDFYLHNTEIKKHFNVGDTICAGAWMYVPAQTYSQATTINNPYFQLVVQSLANGSQYASVMSAKIYDNWIFVSSTLTITKADLDYIYFQFWMSNSVEKPDGTYFYVDSVYLTKGPGSMYYLKSQIFNREVSPFGVDSGDGMVYRFGAETLAEYDLLGSKGDRISNPNKATAGAFKYLECITDGDRAATSGLWKPCCIPPNIPTTNQGAGTVWANNNVLTLGV